MLQEPKFQFIGRFEKLGIGYIENDKRDAIVIDIPEDKARELFRIFHGGTPEED